MMERLYNSIPRVVVGKFRHVEKIHFHSRKLMRPLSFRAENYAAKTVEAIKQTHAALNRHPNFSRLLFVAETSGEVMVVEEYCRQSLRSYIRMCSSLLREHHPGRSGGKSSMDIRVRFIFYQLLKAVKFLHDQGLCAGALASDRIHIDSLGWITLPPALGERAAECAERCAMLLQHAVSAPVTGDTEPGPATPIGEIRPVLLDWMNENNKRGKRSECVERPPGYYEPLTLRWLRGHVCWIVALSQLEVAAPHRCTCLLV